MMYIDNDLSCRDRKRNFVTARTGFVGVCLVIVGTIIFYFIYNFEFWTFEMYSLDSSTKAYLIAVYSDVLDCIVNPCVLLIGSPSVRNAIHKWKLRQSIQNLLNKFWIYFWKNGNFWYLCKWTKCTYSFFVALVTPIIIKMELFSVRQIVGHRMKDEGWRIVESLLQLKRFSQLI